MTEVSAIISIDNAAKYTFNRSHITLQNEATKFEVRRHVYHCYWRRMRKSQRKIYFYQMFAMAVTDFSLNTATVVHRIISIPQECVKTN